MEYSFDIELAQAYGVDAAIFLKNMQFWITKNAAHNVNHQDGRTWTYNSYEALQKLFPFWTIRQIKYLTKQLSDQNVIIIKQNNKQTGDNRNWYAFVNEDQFLPTHIKTPSSTLRTNLSEGFEQNCPNPHLIYTDSKHKKNIYKKNSEKIESTTAESKKKAGVAEMRKIFTEFQEKMKKGLVSGKNIKDYPPELQGAVILAWYSLKTKKRILPVHSNLKYVLARLNEGVDEEDIRCVIMMKYQQWKDDPKMNRYVRISTLLRPSKFYDYLSELRSDE